MNIIPLDRPCLQALMTSEVPEFADGSVQAIVEASKSWECRIVAITYLASRIVLGLRTRQPNALEHVGRLYSLPSKMWFSVNECDVEFVEFMLIHVRRESLTLEEEIVELVGDQERRSYETSIRV